MNGIFHKQRFQTFFNILGLFSGIFLVVLFGFFLATGEFSSLDDQIASWFFAGFGLFATALCAVSLYVNKHAFIRAEEQGITAFCHFGLNLKCSYSQIRHVSFGAGNLGIHLHNGKKFNIMHLENGHQLCQYILRRIPGRATASLEKQELLDILVPLRKKHSRLGIASICCFLLIFPSIILTAALTGWKDLQDFHAGDWQIFAAMAGVSILIIAASMILLRQFLLQENRIHELQGSLYQTVLRTSPTPPGNPVRMYLDNEHHTSIRLIVFGFPNSEEVYFTVEQVDPDYAMEQIYTSKVYPTFRELEPEIVDMIEIPLPLPAHPYKEIRS